MVEAPVGGGGGKVSFPVVFFDGECETDIGNVVIHQAMDFKAFQSILSRKIGISPHQFSVYIADSNNPRNRVLITGKVDFSAVSREKGCFFLVVLKRTRRSGTRKGKNVESYTPSETMRKEPPANVMLLRRGGGGGGNNLTDARVFTGLDEFERRVRDLQLEKERYMVNLGRANLRIERESRSLVCEECENAKVVGREVGFHWCVYDAVTFGFRSHAGPVARPDWFQSTYEKSAPKKLAFDVPFELIELQKFDYALERVSFQSLIQMPNVVYASTSDATEATAYLAVEDFLHATVKGLWEAFWKKAIASGKLESLCATGVLLKNPRHPHGKWDNLLELALLRPDIRSLDVESEQQPFLHVLGDALFYALRMLISRNLSRQNFSLGSNSSLFFLLILNMAGL
ncbi:hypothetical protein REPUB_Repub02eG0209300 [Reevesia pubescens]